MSEAKQQEDDVEHAMWRDDSHQSGVEAASGSNSEVLRGGVSSLRAMGGENGTSPASSSVAVVASGVPEISKGDRVSVDATLFDGDEPGSYSNDHPGRHYGVVTSFKSKNLVRVRWESTKMVELCRLSDLLLDVNYGRPAPRAIAAPQHSHYSQSTASPVAKSNSDDGRLDESDGYDSDASELSDSSRVLREMGVHDAHDGELEESSRTAEDRAAADCAATSSAFVASLQAIGILDAQGSASPQYQGIMTRHAVQKMEGEVRRHQTPTPQRQPEPSRSGVQARPSIAAKGKQASPEYQRHEDAPRRGDSRRRQSRPADEQCARGHGQLGGRSAQSSSTATRGRSPDESSSTDPSPGGLRGGAHIPRNEKWFGAEPSFHGQRRFEDEGPEPPSFYS